jgi:hypothetical protein
MRESIVKISSFYVDRDDESGRLSDLYVEMGGLPPKSRDDAMHIAVATIQSCDVIVSWNFRHIVNLRAMKAVEAVNTQEGYELIKILSPTMMLNEED